MSNRAKGHALRQPDTYLQPRNPSSRLRRPERSDLDPRGGNGECLAVVVMVGLEFSLFVVGVVTAIF